MRRLSPVALSVIALAVVMTFAYLQGRWYLSSQAATPPITTHIGANSAHVQTARQLQATPTYIYSTLKTAVGFVLARAPRGSSGQPLGAPQTVASFGNNFGLAESDSVLSMQLSPDGRYLAINAAQDHGEQVWIFDTQQRKISVLPANVSGNFLNWMPGGNGYTFLYRPMFPLGPDAPLTNGSWNPGLWEVDAATGAFKNIDIQMPSAFLVDAAASPDGSRIVYSTSTGLGLGSTIWMMRSDGSQLTRLFSVTGQAQAIAAMFAWSPNGASIAYELLADSPTPFLPAGLWVMNSNGGQPRYMAAADGGHGYRLAWSPDGSKIAFVVRTNTSDRQADALAQSLQCAVGVVDVASARSWLVASPAQTGMQLNYA
ncbi:MAG TPA: hypothetical protein VNE61_00270, partial [Ktedonobacteraceae bacterium]|nr:hypothetical protein [Ktedonobacteraceae bacterium]